jgi:hypothetical protein
VILAGKEICKLNFGRARQSSPHPQGVRRRRAAKGESPCESSLELPNHLAKGDLDGKIVEMGITCVGTGAFMDETRVPGGIRQDTESLVRRALTVEAAEHDANAWAIIQIIGTYTPECGLEGSTGPANG